MRVGKEVGPSTSYCLQVNVGCIHVWDGHIWLRWRFDITSQGWDAISVLTDSPVVMVSDTSKSVGALDTKSLSVSKLYSLGNGDTEIHSVHDCSTCIGSRASLWLELTWDSKTITITWVCEHGRNASVNRGIVANWGWIINMSIVTWRCNTSVIR